MQVKHEKENELKTDAPRCKAAASAAARGRTNVFTMVKSCAAAEAADPAAAVAFVVAGCSLSCLIFHCHFASFQKCFVLC